MALLNWILPLFKPSFWFNMQYLPFMPWLEQALPIVMAALVAIGIGLLVFGRFGKGLEKERRMMFRQLGTKELMAGLVGLLLFFFHWQRVPFLTMRVLWLIWAIGFGYWAYVIWKEHFKVGPAERAKAAERAAYEKWLPKPKK